jgi:hypothetical protein
MKPRTAFETEAEPSSDHSPDSYNTNRRWGAKLSCGARTHACRVETFSTPISFLLRDSPGGKRRYLQMIQRRRRLPHVYPDSASSFVTWSLHGVLPRCIFASPRLLN